jgi:hypothetical protein
MRVPRREQAAHYPAITMFPLKLAIIELRYSHERSNKLFRKVIKSRITLISRARERAPPTQPPTKHTCRANFERSRGLLGGEINVRRLILRRWFGCDCALLHIQRALSAPRIFLYERSMCICAEFWSLSLCFIAAKIANRVSRRQRGSHHTLCLACTMCMYVCT